jgi:hypothetical protein
MLYEDCGLYNGVILCEMVGKVIRGRVDKQWRAPSNSVERSDQLLRRSMAWLLIATMLSCSINASILSAYNMNCACKALSSQTHGAVYEPDPASNRVALSLDHDVSVSLLPCLGLNVQHVRPRASMSTWTMDTRVGLFASLSLASMLPMLI